MLRQVSVDARCLGAVGHSWGSYLGLLVASAAPELLYADIGMGQVSYQLRPEAAAHQSILDQCRARGDIAMVRMQQAAPVSMTQILSAADLRFWDDAMNGATWSDDRESFKTEFNALVNVSVFFNKASIFCVVLVNNLPLKLF